MLLLSSVTCSSAARRLAILLALATPVIGCKGSGSDAQGAAPGSSSSPAASGSAAAAGAGVSASGSSGAAATSPPDTPVAPEGTGASNLSPLASVAECQMKEAELGAYLQRGEIAIAAREGGISASWMVQLPNKQDAQIAFGGYDGQAKQVGRVRGIGTSREHGPRVFATGSVWTVTWFDSDGLAYTRPPWDMSSAPTLEHVGTVGKAVAENVALASTPSGPVVAVAPFGANQLGVFLFAPTEPGAPPVRALAVSRQAKQPRRPAVAADAGGYSLAWLEEGDAIVASRFDAEGKEGDGVRAVAPAGPERRSLSIVATSSGSIALWTEGDTILARALDKQAQPVAAPQVVVKGGKWPSITSAGEGALVCWIGQGGKAEGQLLAVKLSAKGSPSAKGLQVTDDGHAVKDPPACAMAGSRAAFAWTEVMSATVSTKRALLRTVESSCMP